MRKTSTFALVLLFSAAGAALAIYAIRRRHHKKMVARVSDEGYETAHDVLFPKNSRGDRLHYGPVIPK